MDSYYTFLDEAAVGKTYNWASLNIDLNFNKSEINIDSILNGEKVFGDTENEMLFIHEYIHYLQNFYTSWGTLVFCEFVLALEKMGAARVNESFSLSLPLKIQKQEGASLWNDGVVHYDRFRCLISGDAAIIMESLVEFPSCVVKKCDEEHLEINNSLISCKVDCKTIREHMAELSACLFMNYTDQQIHDRYISKRSLCAPLGRLAKQPEYWILFEYFYHNKYDNVAEGLVLLSHAALCSANPVKVICRFFKFMEEFRQEMGNDLLKAVSGFLNMPSEIVAYSYSYYASIKSVINQLQLCTKHYDDDFYKLSGYIFTQLLTNLNLHFSAKLFFRNPTELRHKKFWINTILTTGTPIIRYKDKVPIIGSNNHDLINSLTYFLGVVKVLENLQNTNSNNCPFHTEYNICKAIYKDNEKCLHEPVNVTNPLNNGKECLYQNALVLLGLKERLVVPN